MLDMGRTSKKSIVSLTERADKGFFKRIDKRKKALARPGKRPLSDSEVSIRAGIGNRDYLNNMRKQFRNGKQKGVRSEHLEGLAAALETTPEWLLREEGPENISETDHLDSEAVLSDRAEQRTVPIAGWVRAGAEATFIPLDAGELDRVPAPANATERTQCLEVRGQSLGELFDRWLVFYDDVRSPVTQDLVRKLCVIGLADDRVVVKQISREKGQYVLLSNTEPPMRDVDILWAAKVIDMRPR